jgi:non-homologous end joining protein Ku
MTAATVKGYKCGRGQFVTFTPEELKALDIERIGAFLLLEGTTKYRLLKDCGR